MRAGNDLGNEVLTDLLLTHFSHGRRLIEKYAGHEISAIGDAFMVAFRTAADALNCSGGYLTKSLVV